jgi:hypothetical protein
MRSTKLSAILALAFCAAQHAQAAPLVDSQATLTNLRLQLTDLDPSDGIAPAITFLPSVTYSFDSPPVRTVVDTNWGLGVRQSGISPGVNPDTISPGFYETPYNKTLAGAPFSPEVVGALAPEGVTAAATKSATGATATSSLDTRTIANFLSWATPGAWNQSQLESMSGVGGPFSLTPHTKVELVADYSLTSIVNTEAIQALAKDNLSEHSALNVRTSAGVSAGISLPDPRVGHISVSNDGAVTQLIYGFDPSGITNLDPSWDTARSGTIHLAWSNDLNVAQEGNLGIGVNSESSLELPATVQAIPEPGTFALQGLGLIGLAACLRRQRR